MGSPRGSRMLALMLVNMDVCAQRSEQGRLPKTLPLDVPRFFVQSIEPRAEEKIYEKLAIPVPEKPKPETPKSVDGLDCGLQTVWKQPEQKALICRFCGKVIAEPKALSKNRRLFR